MPGPFLIPIIIAVGGAIAGGTAVAAADDLVEEGTVFVEKLTKSALLLGVGWAAITYRKPIGSFIRRVVK